MSLSLLVLGGTRFVGRHIVAAAIDAGHRVTLFNRGNHPDVFPDLEQITGDRTLNLSPLAGRSFDAVVDTSGYVPRVVADAVGALKGAVDRYAFVSTISVYREPVADGVDEDGPLAALEDPTTEEITGETYGGLKVLCEEAVRAGFPDAFVVRPGVVAGPYDPTDRFTWWCRRIAQGGEVLAPGRPDDATQYIDGRDLAQFVVDSLERGRAGTFNAVVPRMTMGELLDACREVSGSDARFTWVDEAFLDAHEVEPFVEVPLWVPAEDRGLLTVDSRRARADGLRIRPLRDTIRDTLAYDRSLPADRALAAGLSPERERQLLAAWHAR